MSNYGSIALILLCSTLMGTLFKRIHVPAIVGQLLVGIILGPSLLGWVHFSEELSFLAEFGVLVLMFLAGLGSDLSLLKRNATSSMAVGVMGIVFSLAIFAAVSCIWYSPTEALFIGIVFAATSVSITVSVLQEYGKLNTAEGATLLGASVIDDILSILVLSFFVAFRQHTSSAGGLQLVLSLLYQILFLVGAYLVVKFLIKPYMQFFEKMPIFGKRTLAAIILFLVMAELAKWTGLSDVIGAFFAGLAIGQCQDDVVSEVDTTLSALGNNFFVPIFFASIGLELSVHNLSHSLVIILVFTILSILTKVLGCGLAAHWTGLKGVSGLIVGAGMVSRGEMALVVAQIGLAEHLVNHQVYSGLIVAIILSTLAAPFLLKYTFSLADKKSA